MKKFLLAAFLFTFSFILIACDSNSSTDYFIKDGGTEDYLGEVQTVLEDQGFTMVESVLESELEALSDTISTNYSLSVTPITLQYGEMTDATTTQLYYADVVQVSTSTQAQQYYDALDLDSSVTCYLFVYHDVVVQTDSQVAYNALNTALS